MSVSKTRVDTSLLRSLVATTALRIDELEVMLRTLCVVLTVADRRRIPRPRKGFIEAALTMNELMGKRPVLALVAEYEVEAVREDIENALLVNPLLPKLKSLLRIVADSRLQWLAEAQDQTFAAYNVAKVVAKRDGSLAELIEPIQEVLAQGPRKAESEEDDAENTED